MVYKYKWPIEGAEASALLSPRVPGSPASGRLRYGDLVFTNGGGVFAVVQVRRGWGSEQGCAGWLSIRQGFATCGGAGCSSSIQSVFVACTGAGWLNSRQCFAMCAGVCQSNLKLRGLRRCALLPAAGCLLILLSSCGVRGCVAVGSWMVADTSLLIRSRRAVRRSARCAASPPRPRCTTSAAASCARRCGGDACAGGRQALNL